VEVDLEGQADSDRLEDMVVAAAMVPEQVTRVMALLMAVVAEVVADTMTLMEAVAAVVEAVVEVVAMTTEVVAMTTEVVVMTTEVAATVQAVVAAAMVETATAVIRALHWIQSLVCTSSLSVQRKFFIKRFASTNIYIDDEHDKNFKSAIFYPRQLQCYISDANFLGCFPSFE